MVTAAHLLDMFTPYGDHYIAVNEAGRLRSARPMRLPDHPYEESYRRPIDAGVANGHLVFFIHGGLNNLHGVIRRIQESDQVYGEERWHPIHLAWDTSLGSTIDDIILRFNRWTSWRNLRRLLGYLLFWNWLGSRRGRRQPAIYFGDIIWRSEYDTARAALTRPDARSAPRDRGFYRAFQYLEQQVQEHPEVKVSLVIHSAGSLVANYLLKLFVTDFPGLRSRVSSYLLLAPACHLTQFQDALSGVAPAHPAVVLTLSPECETTDPVGARDVLLVYEKSLLWAIHDLFESGWSRDDYQRYGIPLAPSKPLDHPLHRAILGIEDLVAGLEGQPDTLLDRTMDGKARWAYTDDPVTIGNFEGRVWTRARSHAGIDDEDTTRESIKLLLSRAP